MGAIEIYEGSRVEFLNIPESLRCSVYRRFDMSTAAFIWQPARLGGTE